MKANSLLATALAFLPRASVAVVTVPPPATPLRPLNHESANVSGDERALDVLSLPSSSLVTILPVHTTFPLSDDESSGILENVQTVPASPAPNVDPDTLVSSLTNGHDNEGISKSIEQALRLIFKDPHTNRTQPGRVAPRTEHLGAIPDIRPIVEAIVNKSSHSQQDHDAVEKRMLLLPPTSEEFAELYPSHKEMLKVVSFWNAILDNNKTQNSNETISVDTANILNTTSAMERAMIFLYHSTPEFHHKNHAITNSSTSVTKRQEASPPSLPSTLTIISSPITGPLSEIAVDAFAESIGLGFFPRSRREVNNIADFTVPINGRLIIPTLTPVIIKGERLATLNNINKRAEEKKEKENKDKKAKEEKDKNEKEAKDKKGNEDKGKKDQEEKEKDEKKKPSNDKKGGDEDDEEEIEDGQRPLDEAKEPEGEKDNEDLPMIPIAHDTTEMYDPVGLPRSFPLGHWPRVKYERQLGESRDGTFKFLLRFYQAKETLPYQLEMFEMWRRTSRVTKKPKAMQNFDKIHRWLKQHAFTVKSRAYLLTDDPKSTSRLYCTDKTKRDLRHAARIMSKPSFRRLYQDHLPYTRNKVILPEWIRYEMLEVAAFIRANQCSWSIGKRFFWPQRRENDRSVVCAEMVRMLVKWDWDAILQPVDQGWSGV